MNTTKILAFMCLAIVGLQSAAQAGVLNGHAAARNGVAGSVPFNNGSGLSGTVDYAVFTAAAFNANFAGLGHVASGGLVYAYQVENTGSLSITGETITLPNPANSIGTFNIGDVDAMSATLIQDAEWTFAPGIAPGESSWGLAYSSFSEPIVGFSTIVDGGMPHMFAGVPVPGHVPIPEPGTAILAFGALWSCSSQRFRNRRNSAPQA